MLTRQWQMGEFIGEDAGTAIIADVDIDSSRINRYSQNGQAALPFDESFPLEARVEKEAVKIDLLLSVQMGRHFLELLELELSNAGSQNSYDDLFIDAYQLEIPAVQDADEAWLFGNKDAWQLMATVAGKSVDGASLYDDLKNNNVVASTVTSGGMSVSGGDANAVDAAAAAFIAWFERVYEQPASATDTAWSPSHMEYRFACSSPNIDSGDTSLVANEYYQGHLDWFAFDIDENYQFPADKPGETFDENVQDSHTLKLYPSPVKYEGMPANRWWEFEDGRTDLGDIDASTTDVARMLFAEFALIYSNDWSIVPFNLPVGSLSQVSSMTVTDSFGVKIQINAAGSGEDDAWQQWRMFTLSKVGSSQEEEADTRLFLPPALLDMFESDPVESVNFIRDEMSNLVWGIETRVSNELGGGISGHEASSAKVKYLKSIAPEPTAQVLIANQAKIKYQLAGSVPENWIPFIPVQITGSNRSIQLQRASMPRVLEGYPQDPVAPRTDLLTEVSSPFYVYEEEVPRAGAIVNRTWQRTRWTDGTPVVWMGRRKNDRKRWRSKRLAV